MSDQDLVAVIYPVIYKDRPALSVEPILAHPRCIVPGSWKQQQTQPSQSYPLKSNDDTCPKEQAPINLPYIPLRFSCGPRTSLGFVFGTDPKSDIHLGNTNGISNYHFALTYKNTFNDGYYRLVVRDLGSSGGTMVIYRGTKTNKAKAPRAGRYNKGKEKRRNFDWILHGFPHPDTASYVSVKVAIDFELLIMVVKHDLRSPAYIDNVRRFRQGQIDPETLFGVLDIQSLRPTGLHTLSDTPGSQPMLLYEQKLSEGTFGAVTQAWDVSTGISYALKEPIGDCYNKQDWKEEIDMMASLSHEHIVKIFLAGTEPTPYMYIELMPLGNLENVHETASLSRQECVVILHQGMSALAYLHAECIAHRDIKPQNILVRHRGQNSLHIKLTDFGLSKAGSLRSIVGTWTYLAPEIATGAEEYYTQAVDIWSLGVVILRFTHGLPPPGYGRGWIWCQKIADHAARCGIENPMSLLRRMLVIEPSSRPSAEACLHETSQLLMAFEERRITPLSRVGMVTNKPSGGLELQGQARVQRWHPQADRWMTMVKSE
ncbi:kinase-like protein [Poronia punctata]|nr:kinase-like protein [Poronia punctata]